MRALFFGMVWFAAFVLILGVFVMTSARIRRITGTAGSEIPRRTWVAILIVRLAILVWFVVGLLIAVRYR